MSARGIGARDEWGQVRAGRTARWTGAKCGPSVRRGEAGRCGVLVSGFLIQNKSMTGTGCPQSGRRCRQTLRCVFGSRRIQSTRGSEAVP